MNPSSPDIMARLRRSALHHDGTAGGEITARALRAGADHIEFLLAQIDAAEGRCEYLEQQRQAHAGMAWYFDDEGNPHSWKTRADAAEAELEAKEMGRLQLKKWWVQEKERAEKLDNDNRALFRNLDEAEARADAAEAALREVQEGHPGFRCQEIARAYFDRTTNEGDGK